MSRTRTFLTTILAVLLLTASYATAAPGKTHTGTVVRALTAGGYTYMDIKEGADDFWIVGPQTNIDKGARVTFSEQVWMTNFPSKALHRTFDRVLFVNAVLPAGSAKAKQAAKASLSPAAKAARKYTISELYSKKSELAGHMVKVHGKVVKVSENIMDRTWVHIKDGTGEAGTNKVIFRSVNGTAKVGDEVTAVGRLETDKDFGFGYFYPVIVEDATFTK